MNTNFFPIKIYSKEFQIERIDYTNSLLQNLRKDHNNTHSFFRNGEFIYISPMSDVELNCGKIVNLNVQENMDVVRSLVKHIFFRTFREHFSNILPLSFYPFRFLSRKKEDDIVYKYLPPDLRNHLSFKKQIEIQFREIKINDHKSLGAVISTRYRWIFNKNCQMLIEEGYDLHDSLVLHSEQIPGLEGILAPTESLVGKVNSYNENLIEVETNDGINEFPSEELFLHKSKSNIKRYLDNKIGIENTDKIFKFISYYDITRLDGKNLFYEIDKIGNQIANLKYLNNDGFSFSISKSHNLPDNSFKIIEPVFLFDYTPGKTHSNADAGLNEYGPYDSNNFDIKNPKVLVICHKTNRGGFSVFLDKFKDGIPETYYYKKGFKKKYELHEVDFLIDEFGSYDYQEYEKTLKKQVRMNSDHPFDLAIIETKEHFKQFDSESNPYYKAKSYLMTLGIPVQFITNSNVRKSDYELQFICNSMALQLYAKLGGTPWVLPANRNIDREIIVGIGSSTIHKNIFAGNTQERVVGITTFFSGDGKYLLSSKCRDVPYEEYFDELLNNLKTSIKEISLDYGWQDGDTVRIIFHIFKPIKNIEADVVEKLVSEYSNYKVVFAFVTVSERHPFLLFNPSQTGMKQKNQIKGRYVPYRATNFILDDESCLLQIKGPKEIKTARQKFSNPVLIRIHEKSTFRDLNYVVQQIFNFTTLSWRGFLPIQKPVTIYYSDLIAGLLSGEFKYEVQLSKYCIFNKFIFSQNPPIYVRGFWEKMNY